MANNALHKVVEQAKENRRRNRWNKIVTGMAALVVFCTTYALILPAITEEREPMCGLEEHVHTEKCYALPKLITCPYEKDAENGTLHPVVHVHDALCYDTEGNLICAMPELESHVHDYWCYTDIEAQPPHVHSDECYEDVEVLICGQEESEGHAHSADCFDESGSLICELPESEGHTHTADCYETQHKLICEKDAVSEEEAAALEGTVEHVLICGKDELILHQHTADCRDENGVLVCGMQELFAHQHGPECLSTTKDPEAEPVLICGLEAHTHDDTCYTDLEADLETPEMWEALLPDKTGVWADDLLAVAVTQLGYEESTANVTVTPEGAILGYTRYGQWAGAPYGDWSLNFLDFCQHYAGIPADAFPVHEGQLRWCDKLSEENWNIYWTPAQYTPVPGDTVFLDMDVDGRMDSAAIVWQLTEAAEDTEAVLTVIQGDVSGAVAKAEYQPTDPVILGYGSLAAAKSRWDILNPPPAPEPVRYCGLEEHTHGEGCYDAEQNLICEIPEHTHADACLVRPVVYYCGLEEHTHDERCYDNEGNRICGLEEHTHQPLCQVESPYCCGKEEHEHTDACYDENNVLICGLEAHAHGESCMLAEQTVEAQLLMPLSELSWEVTPGTSVTVSGLLPNGSAVTAVPVNVDGLLFAFNVTLYDANGSEIEPVLPVKVDMRVPGITDDPNRSLTGVHGSLTMEENEDGATPVFGTPEPVPSSTDESGVFTIIVPHFSYLGADDEIGGGDGEGGEGGAGSNEIYPPFAVGCTEENCPICRMLNIENWVDGSEENPFGSAGEFNLFCFGDLTNFGCVHGNAAIMGRIVGTSNDITYEKNSIYNYSAHNIPDYDIGLILGNWGSPLGDDVPFDEKVTIANGSVAATKKAHEQLLMDDKDRDHRHLVEDPDQLAQFFANAFDSLLNHNQHTFSYCTQMAGVDGDTHLGKPPEYLQKEAGGNQIDEIGLIGTADQDFILRGSDPFYNVFNLDPAAFSPNGNTPREVFLDVPYGSYTVINLVGDPNQTGETLSFGLKLRYKNSNGIYIDQPADKAQNTSYSQYQRTLINIDPDIGKLTCPCAGLYIYGSVLGPDTDFEVTGSGEVDLQGNIVLGSITGLHNSNTIYNPFIAGSRLYISKDMICDDEEHTDYQKCPIEYQNHLSEKGWTDWYADLTLESVDTSGETHMTKTITGVPLNDEPIRLDGLTPGTYKIAAEDIYYKATDTNGKEVVIHVEMDTNALYYWQETDNGPEKVYCDQTGKPNSPDGEPKQHPYLGYHHFTYVTIGLESAGQATTYNDEYFLTVTEGMNDRVQVSNHYNTTEKTRFTMAKQWIRVEQDALGKELIYYLDGPGEDEPLHVFLQKRPVDSPEGTPYTDYTEFDGYHVTLQDGEWYYTWVGLPTDLEYAVREDPYPGFTLDSEKSGFDETTGIFYLVNKTRNQGAHTLGVQKIWYDEKGVVTDTPKDYTKENGTIENLTVHLCRQIGDMPTLEELETDIRQPLRTLAVYYESKADQNKIGEVRVPYGAKATINLHVTGRDPYIEVPQFAMKYLQTTSPIQLGVMKSEFDNPYYRQNLTFTIQMGGDTDLILYAPSGSNVPNGIWFEGGTPVTDYEGYPYNDKYKPSAELYTYELTDDWITWRENADGSPQLEVVTPEDISSPSHPRQPGNVSLAPDADNVWEHIWYDLPTRGVDWDDKGVQREYAYRYYVLEDVPERYEPTYTVIGKNVRTADEITAPDGMKGITEGMVIIRNRPIIGGPELPYTGGIGTAPYTFGGLLASSAALFLARYKVKKRRKEETGD